MILEIVAGIIGKGKSPSDADKREYLEETRDNLYLYILTILTQDSLSLIIIHI